jgi:hypothetical protein
LTVDTAPLFTPKEVQDAQRWLTYIGGDFTGEIPSRIHEQGRGQAYGLGSSPPFSPEFIGYIGTLACKNEHCSRCRKRATEVARSDTFAYHSNERTRTTRAFRKLRRHAPLEFDALNLAVKYHLNVAEITDKLNERAITKGFEDRYTQAGVAVLIMSGIGKLQAWW